MNFAFYISGNSTRLTRFLNKSKVELIKDIKLVVSDGKMTEQQKLCLVQHEIPIKVVDYSSIIGKNRKEKNRILSDKMLNYLKENRIDYCFSFGSHVLSGDLLTEYKWKLINFHPSILPMYPGQNAIDQAIAHGNTFLVGNTVHFINEGIDTGNIIMQSVIPLYAFFNNDKNYDIVLDIQVEMLQQLIQVIQEKRLIVDKNGNVNILKADYNRYNIYPKIR